MVKDVFNTSKIKSILKAFVVIAVLPILIVGGIIAVSFVAPYCFGDISHPLMGMIATIIMIPWGILFVIVFFMGCRLTPSVVVVSTGRGGYSVQSGRSRNGNGIAFLFNIIKFILLVPTALLIWIIVSIIILFNEKLQIKIDEQYENFVLKLKEWYKVGVVFFVVAPLIVLGFNTIENKAYSPKNIQIECVDFYYINTWEQHSFNTGTYQQIDDYYFEYTINPNGKDITEIKGEWVFINKNTSESFSIDAGTFVPFDWYWKIEDKNFEHKFNTTISISKEDKEQIGLSSDNLDNLKIVCKINYISCESNIPILGDFLFPTVDNEYKGGYEIVVKP